MSPFYATSEKLSGCINPLLAGRGLTTTSATIPTLSSKNSRTGGGSPQRWHCATCRRSGHPPLRGAATGRSTPPDSATRCQINDATPRTNSMICRWVSDRRPAVWLRPVSVASVPHRSRYLSPFFVAGLWSALWKGAVRQVDGCFYFIILQLLDLTGLDYKERALVDIVVCSFS